MKTLLVVRWDGKIGDTIVSSFFFREVKRLLGFHIKVITTKALCDIYTDDLHVADVITCVENPDLNSIARLYRNIGSCDVLVHLTQRINAADEEIIKKLKPSRVFSLDDGSSLVTDKLGKVTQGMGFIDKYAYVLRLLGAESINKKLIVPKSKSNDTDNHNDYILFNPFGSRVEKSINPSTSARLLSNILESFPKKMVYILSSPRTKSDAKEICRSLDNPRVVCFPNITNIRHAIFAIEKAEQVITVDTAICHISYALKKKLVAIYPEFPNENPWLPPEQETTAVVKSGTGEHCSNMRKSMNSFSIEKVVREMVSLDRYGKNEKSKNKV